LATAETVFVVAPITIALKNMAMNLRKWSAGENIFNPENLIRELDIFEIRKN